MVSIIISLEQQIAGRLDLARQRMQENGDIDGEIAAAVADIHTWCTAIDRDVQLMVNSGW